MNTREIAVEYRLAHWAQIMQDRAQSGMSIRAYCKSAGIHENVYYYWQRKLREAACEQLNVPGFAEVRMATTGPSPMPMGMARPSGIRVEVGGLQIAVDNAYPADKLAVLLRALMRP